MCLTKPEYHVDLATSFTVNFMAQNDAETGIPGAEPEESLNPEIDQLMKQLEGEQDIGKIEQILAELSQLVRSMELPERFSTQEYTGPIDPRMGHRPGSFDSPAERQRTQVKQKIALVFSATKSVRSSLATLMNTLKQIQK